MLTRWMEKDHPGRRPWSMAHMIQPYDPDYSEKTLCNRATEVGKLRPASSRLPHCRKCQYYFERGYPAREFPA